MPFQPTLLAVTTFPEPPNTAFQPPVRCGLSLKFNVKLQPLIAAVPVLLTVTSNWYPFPQLFTSFAVHVSPPELTEPTELEELVLLLDGNALDITELLLDEDGAAELRTELEETAAPTIPKGAGCAAQVLREIQLRLFS